MEKIHFTVEADGTSEGLELGHLPPDQYILLIFKEKDPRAWQNFYHGFVLPHVSTQFMEYTGYHISDEDMHEVLKKKCNGGRSTANMAAFQWQNFILSVKSYTINCLNGVWLEEN